MRAHSRLIPSVGVDRDGSQRSRVVDAVRELFSAGGYEALTLHAVSQLSGVSRPRVHLEFGDRPGLLRALVEHDSDALISLMGVSLPRGETLAVTVRAQVATFVDFVAERRAMYRLIFGYTGRLELDFEELISGFRERLVDLYLEAFEASVLHAGGHWPDPSQARIVAHGSISLAEGAVQAWLADPAVDRGTVIDVITEMVCTVILGTSRRAQSAMSVSAAEPASDLGRAR